MNDSDTNTDVLRLPVPRKARVGFLFLSLLAVLGTGALVGGIAAPRPSVALRSAALSDVTTLLEQSVPPHVVRADTDPGPGVAEPLLVGSW